MVIKHLVLPGGGPHGMTDMGIINYCIKHNFIDRKNIKSIHATSVGTFCALMICFPDSIEDFEDYVINSMMDKMFYIDPDNIVNIMQAKGLLVEDCFHNYLKPFFDVNNIDLDITLKDFCTYCKKDLFLYATRISDFSQVCLSNEDFPNMKLIDAIHASCAIPGIISPVVYDNELYIDGGTICNYPLEECVNKENVDPSEVLGVRHVFPPPESVLDINDFNIFGLIFYILSCVVNKFLNIITQEKNNKETKKKVEKATQINMYIDAYLLTFNELMESFQNKEVRKKNVEKGYRFAKQHFEEQGMLEYIDNDDEPELESTVEKL